MELYVPAYEPTGEEIAVFHTAKGDITALLRGTETPVSVGLFVELAREGFYKDLNFYAREEGRMVRGGCPSTRDLTPAAAAYLAPRSSAGIGGGNSGRFIKREELPRKQNFHVRGALVLTHVNRMALVSCQFYFCLAPVPDKDLEDTVIGEVVEGMDVVEKIQGVETDKNDRPLEDIRILKATVTKDLPQPEKKTPAKKKVVRPARRK